MQNCNTFLLQTSWSAKHLVQLESFLQTSSGLTKNTFKNGGAQSEDVNIRVIFPNLYKNYGFYDDKDIIKRQILSKLTCGHI